MIKKIIFDNMFMVVLGAASQVLQYDVPGHMIVFTDSTSDKEWSGLKDTDINPSYLTGDFRVRKLLSYA